MRALHAELGATVLDEHIEFLERALVEEQFQAFARRQLAAPVLGIDARLAAAAPGIGTPFLEFLQNVVHHRLRLSQRP